MEIISSTHGVSIFPWDITPTAKTHVSPFFLFHGPDLLGPAAFAIGGLLALSVGYSRSGLIAATATRGEAVVEAPPLQPPRDRQEMLKQAQQAIQRASEVGVRRRMNK